MSALTAAPPVPYRSIVDALIILVREDHILLAQRQGTGYADGAWNLPSGKLEHGETVSRAAIREGQEEIGVRIRENALRFVHLIHYRNLFQPGLACPNRHTPALATNCPDRRFCVH